MANTRSSNVIRVDTTAAFTAPLFIRTIKIIGVAASSATIRDDASASGSILWEDATTSNRTDSDVCINATRGVHVTIAGTAVVYLYLE